MLDTFFFFVFHHNFRFVFLNRCHLKEIDSTCIIFEEKSNFLKKRFFSNLWKILTCWIKMDAIFWRYFFLKIKKKNVRKRYPCLCFMHPIRLNQESAATVGNAVEQDNCCHHKVFYVCSLYFHKLLHCWLFLKD